MGYELDSNGLLVYVGGGKKAKNDAEVSRPNDAEIGHPPTSRPKPPKPPAKVD